MAVLTTADRKKLKPSTFAGPDRSFPIPDKVHAEKALQFVGRSEEKGNVTPSEAAHIRSKAHAKLSSGKAKKIGHMLKSA